MEALIYIALWYPQALSTWYKAITADSTLYIYIHILVGVATYSSHSKAAPQRALTLNHRIIKRRILAYEIPDTRRMEFHRLVIIMERFLRTEEYSRGRTRVLPEVDTELITDTGHSGLFTVSRTSWACCWGCCMISNLRLLQTWWSSTNLLAHLGFV